MCVSGVWFDLGKAGGQAGGAYSGSLMWSSYGLMRMMGPLGMPCTCVSMRAGARTRSFSLYILGEECRLARGEGGGRIQPYCSCISPIFHMYFPRLITSW